MAKIHHKTLASAVEKYSPLHQEGQSEDEVKAAIAEDPKEFDTDAINDIYKAIVGGPEKDPEPSKPQKEEKPSDKKKAGRYIVAVAFRDINDFTRVHPVDADVSHFDAGRLEHLVNTGVVKAL